MIDSMTIFLTTHYTLEADMLCETIALINEGRLVALGTPSGIKRNFSRLAILEVVVNETRESLEAELSGISSVHRVETSAEGIFQKMTIFVEAGADAKQRIEEIVGGERIENITVRDQTLEEAYVSILK